MIVETDFVTHWKTELLAELLGDPNAGMYMIRLWSWCQARRCWELSGDPEQLKGICRYKGEGLELKEAMLMAKYLDPLNGDGRIAVHQWKEFNKQLVTSWENGKRGGRKPTPNPNTAGVNPQGTQTPQGLTHKEPKTGAKLAKTEPTPNPNTAGVNPNTAGVNPQGTQTNPRAGVEKSRVDSLSQTLSHTGDPDPEGDKAHRILKERPELSPLTLEQDLAARRDVLGNFPDYDFEGAAPEIADRALKMGTIAHPGAWLSKQYLGLAERYGRKTEKNGGPDFFHGFSS